MSQNFFYSLVVLATVGIAMSWFATRLNRHTIDNREKAKEVIRKRLGAHTYLDVDSFVGNLQIPKEEASHARTLLLEIARLLGVNVASLTRDGILVDLLRVRSIEIVSNHPQENLPEFIEPFTYDLIHILEKSSDKARWEERWRSLPNPPCNEEELADFIMSMDMGKLITFFAPLMKVSP